jgi:hypothetical protein
MFLTSAMRVPSSHASDGEAGSGPVGRALPGCSSGCRLGQAERGGATSTLRGTGATITTAIWAVDVASPAAPKRDRRVRRARRTGEDVRVGRAGRWGVWRVASQGCGFPQANLLSRDALHRPEKCIDCGACVEGTSSRCVLQELAADGAHASVLPQAGRRFAPHATRRPIDLRISREQTTRVRIACGEPTSSRAGVAQYADAVARAGDADRDCGAPSRGLPRPSGICGAAAARTRRAGERLFLRDLAWCFPLSYPNAKRKNG